MYIIDQLGNLLIAPGDVLDKMSILAIKLQKISQNKFVQDEIHRIEQLYTNILAVNPEYKKIVPEVNELAAQLLETNFDQWLLEDRVRTENSWEAAQAARDNNTKRVRVKNEINKLFGYPIEMKDYANNT